MADSEADLINEAMTAYLRLGRHIQALLDQEAAVERVPQVASILSDSMETIPVPAYVSDVETMTSTQNEAMEFFSELRRDAAATMSIVDGLSTILLLPYRADIQPSKRNRPTFIAMSKRAMTLAEKTVGDQATRPAIPDFNVISSLLDAYSATIRERYVHRQQGKEPSMWRTAAGCAVRICQSFRSEGSSNNTGDPHSNMLESLVTLSNSLRLPSRANLPALPELIKDETFDMDALLKVRHNLGINLSSENKQASSQGLLLDSISEDSRKHEQCSGIIILAY